ncbi:MAG: Gfo/Idh/MocA family oxidoreductase [Phenylobacterium sp.]|uniref:Gfo/Idh/MocA family protein n=1 Tax=Phenylobacterium sp. TaxID=1871053 RepID=UPI0025D377EA|nr:Gfo/Idh/MocA family oxidoreductase [Phenylobacterium sp.]MCA3724667.1 Gfo/Idh/MocA family oxidoreductase [Phenylobacterium sp.]MCA3725412.1 Gfo/Idh/MocA family oxidoreductase [Phenylobacterium sp.]
MTKVLRGGVIGAGVFGGYHARQYAQAEGAGLAAVFDPDLERAREVAARHGAAAFDDLDAFLRSVDVVTVASPGVRHAEGALASLRAGRSVYVEKPLAVDLEEADRILAEASRRRLVVACGHQERVVFEAIGLFSAPERPLRLEAVRQGPQSQRSLDISVVLDLMVHDIDLALSLAAGAPLAAEGEGDVAYSGGLDAVRAEVTFDDGFTAVFDASRMAPERRRTMRVVYPSGELEIDFLARTFRNTTGFDLNPDFAETPGARDPLGASVGAFLACVRGERDRPVVTGEEAARALDLALAIEQAVEETGPRHHL